VLFVDTANDRVGIGTSSPTQLLTLDSVNLNAIAFNNTGTLKAAIGVVTSTSQLVTGSVADDLVIRNSSDILFSNNAIERMRITSSGNVGIDSPNPSGKLEVYTGAGTAYFTRSRGDNGSSAPALGISTGASAIKIDSYGDLRFQTATVGGSIAEAMRIDSIEEAVAPSIKFNATSASGGAGNVLFFNQGVQKFNLTTLANSNDLALYNNGGTNSYNFYVKHSDGNVGIGTTSPAHILHTYGTSGWTTKVQGGNNLGAFIGHADGYGMAIRTTQTTNNYYLMNLISGGSSADSGGSSVFIVKANGSVGINNESPFAQFTLYASNNFQTNGTLFYLRDGIDSRTGYYHFHASQAFNNSMQLVYCARGATSAYSFVRYGSAGASDLEFNLRGDGNAYADGSWNGGGADYAEYFESLLGNAIDRGISVVMEGDKVRPATNLDDASKIIGIIRPKGDGIVSSAVGNTAWDRWNKKYLTDDFGEYIREDHNVIEWIEITIDEEGNEKEEKRSYESHNIPADVLVPDDAIIKTHDDSGNKFDHRKLNPDYDETLEYIPREQRDEWVIVGLLGQVPMLKGQPVNPNWIKMKDISETVELWFIK